VSIFTSLSASADVEVNATNFPDDGFRNWIMSNFSGVGDGVQSYIKVNFDDVVIVEHPTIKSIYGVTVHQRWNTARYSDEGYVFMVWDFRSPDEPQIHVRTWQPDYVDKEHGQKLNANDVFTLGDFDL